MAQFLFPKLEIYEKIRSWKGRDSKTMTTLEKITPNYDPWESYLDVEQYGKLVLSNIEFTTTYLCNMRCAHCAVGYTLQTKDPDALPSICF